MNKLSFFINITQKRNMKHFSECKVYEFIGDQLNRQKSDNMIYEIGKDL